MTGDRPTEATSPQRPTPVPRSGARSYARVADSSSSFLEEGATATKSPRRWTAEETSARMAGAPPFRLPRPDEATLDEQVRGYEHITGDPVRRDKKRNLVAACYRVHGDNFLPLVQRLHMSSGTVVNLLGAIRCLTPSEAVRILGAAAADELDDADAPGTSGPDGWPPAVTSSANPRPDEPISPPWDGRGPPGPEAGFFSESELGAPRRSPTAEALNR
jgi:hypothetical protein